MEGGLRVREEPRRRPRITLLDQMSAIAADGRDLSGLSLDDILKAQKRATAPIAAAGTPPPPPPPETPGRTLLDIIRDEDPKSSSFKGFVNRDKKPWRSFKDRIRLRRSGSGAAWTSSVHVPTSDILVPTSRSLVARRSSVRGLFSDSSPSPPRRRSLEPTTSHLGDGENENENDSRQTAVARPQISGRTSCRLGAYSSFSPQNDDRNDAVSDNNNNNSPRASRRGGPQAALSLRPQISRRHSTRFSPAMDDSLTDTTDPLPPQREGSRRLSAVLAEERSLSEREAVAAQEAAEAAATGEASESLAVEAVAAAPVRMSLMDLLEETDRQLGFVGSRYLIGEDDDDEYEEEEAKEIGGGGTGATAEQNCCVCMVRHKGAAFIPCGHTFCRLCSRELWVSRGNCPLCNGFILEILDIF